MFDTPAHRRGRGAQSNRSGRFETLLRMDIDDGWQNSQDIGAAGETTATLRTQWR